MHEHEMRVASASVLVPVSTSPTMAAGPAATAGCCFDATEIIDSAARALSPCPTWHSEHPQEEALGRRTSGLARGPAPAPAPPAPADAPAPRGRWRRAPGPPQSAGGTCASPNPGARAYTAGH
eukprot:CAMPEP_0175358856 /NCGR_PEP_ID=MMETSP0095-20121207/15218_1 /TAXON_ID=311494 /ORGANISM="Alexandrium monilatum, Strain CCMP3105" /LENGTH=122 /DNA_ID=CAMNT_0016656607 /DNA_START=237 /DNA_END=602 /DNA_ORIENTATION=-